MLQLAAAALVSSTLPIACQRRQRPATTPLAVALADLDVVAAGLSRPEGVVADRGGRIYASNADSACVIVSPDGSLRHVGPPISANGIALDRDGRIIIARYGLFAQEPGPLQRLDPVTGALETLAASVNGRALVASNMPVLAADGSIYCTHSTWGPNPIAGIDPAIADGFVYRVTRDGGVAVIAGGIAGANGCCFDETEEHLFVAQTAAGNILRLSRRPDGSYAGPTVHGPLLGEIPAAPSVRDFYERMTASDRSRLGHPDGVGFDIAGNLWVTLPFANRVVAITPDLAIIPVIDDPDGNLMDMPTNLAWGGPDLELLYIVSRRNGRILRTRSPVPGAPQFHQR